MACPAGLSALAASAARPSFSSARPLCPARAARSLAVPGAPRPERSVSLRCALDRSELAGITNADLGLPPWAPSVEELLEFDAMQSMSPSERQEKVRIEAKEAKAAVKGAVAGLFRPLVDNFRDMLGFKYPVRDTEEFHIGMPFGALMTCIGLHQLWKAAPGMCLEVALCYAFYKLSVLAADVRRRGFSPDLIIRLKFILVLIMFFKDIRKNIVPLDYIRVPVFFIYTISVSWDLTGMKKFAKYALPSLIYCFTTGFQIPEARRVKKE
ncbi:unnamed protein product [Urochloa decumbens]|uniref:Uncharacterized protein n=1 Tax=Urochloa decumbens TaxID=240449 RepID=A0ABC9FFG8_9POAL